MLPLPLIRSRCFTCIAKQSAYKPGMLSMVRSLTTAPSPTSPATRSQASTGSPRDSIHGQVTVDRELPDPLKDQYKNMKYAIVYGIGIVVSCAIIFNYEKTTSPVLNSVFYILRRNPEVVEKLGEDIGYASSYPWISGELNTVKGDIDINFTVKGEKASGQLYFKASRPDKITPFTVHHWYLKMGDEIINLKTDELFM